MGGGARPAAAQAGGDLVAAVRPAPGPGGSGQRRLPRGVRRAPRADGRRAGRAPGVPRRQHGDGGGIADVPERAEPPEVVQDITSADGTAWARWICGWSAEENRHSDVFNRYMHLSGRFAMREVERAVQRLIVAGMAVHAPASPFHGFVYIAFQERASAVAHGNTARLVGARRAGDDALARICGTVGGDEKQHGAVYTRIMGKLFEVDPDAAMRTMAYMMCCRISGGARI
uniref:Acyl-ACP desaturase n=1 Tax=Arundo donax TaxID=35708 RepID=A0A0A9DD22_ARUDO